MGIPLKKIAWNGIALDIPQPWELGRLGAHHLVFETSAGTVMEIKWQRVKGRFSAKSHLKRLAGLYGRRSKNAVQPWQLPSSWISALEHHQVDGFQWRTRKTSGHGAVLWCPQCRTASLLQFVGDAIGPADGQESPGGPAPAILKSFRDHRDDGHTLWSVFDIRVMLPDTFRIRDYAFQPGKFQLSFDSRRTSIRLLRWAPAAALLVDQDLADFVASAFGKKSQDIRTVPGCKHPVAEWEEHPPTGFLKRFRRKRRHDLGRVWHIESKNRILGVHIMDPGPLDDQLLAGICESYETV